MNNDGPRPRHWRTIRNIRILENLPFVHGIIDAAGNPINPPNFNPLRHKPFQFFFFTLTPHPPPHPSPSPPPYHTLGKISYLSFYFVLDAILSYSYMSHTVTLVVLVSRLVFYLVLLFLLFSFLAFMLT